MEPTAPYPRLFTDYLRAAKKLAAPSIDAYARDLSDFAAALRERREGDADAAFDADRALAEAGQADIAAYLMRLREEGKSPSTLNRKLASLRAFYRFMVARGFRTENPSADMKSPKVTRKEIEYLTPEEVEKLLEQPDDSVKGIRDRAILELLYATGLRVSEVTEAKVGHVNLRMGFITCTGEHGKARIIPLGRPARAAMEGYLSEGRAKLAGDLGEETALFLNYHGERMTRQGMWKLLKEYAAAVGLEKKITPRTLRNSFAVHMAQNGADMKSLQELLGHEDPTAIRAYLSVSKNHIKDVYDRTHPRA